MGTWHTASWTRRVDAGVPRRDLRSGTYRWYEPDRLGDLALALPPQLDRTVARVERGVQALGHSGSSGDLAGLARFLLRSEAIASSRIEGIAPAARQVAFAELAQERGHAGRAPTRGGKYRGGCWPLQSSRSASASASASP